MAIGNHQSWRVFWRIRFGQSYPSYRWIDGRICCSHSYNKRPNPTPSRVDIHLIYCSFIRRDMLTSIVPQHPNSWLGWLWVRLALEWVLPRLLGHNYHHSSICRNHGLNPLFVLVTQLYKVIDHRGTEITQVIDNPFKFSLRRLEKEETKNK